MADVSTNGRTVWVNSDKTGACIARFCPMSGEVFPEALDATGYLANITNPKGKTGYAEWVRWVEAVQAHHGVEIPKEMRPSHIVEPR